MPDAACAVAVAVARAGDVVAARPPVSVSASRVAEAARDFFMPCSLGNRDEIWAGEGSWVTDSGRWCSVTHERGGAPVRPGPVRRGGRSVGVGGDQLRQLRVEAGGDREAG